MPVTIVIESYEEFSERHGGSPMPVGARLVFPDGAMVHGDNGDIRAEPPTDPHAVLLLQRAYYDKAARLAEQEFHGARSQFSQQASFAARYPGQVPNAPENAAEILEDLKAIAQRHREKLAEINVALSATPQAEAQRQREAREADYRNRAAQTLAAINSVNL